MHQLYWGSRRLILCSWFLLAVGLGAGCAGVAGSFSVDQAGNTTIGLKLPPPAADAPE